MSSSAPTAYRARYATRPNGETLPGTILEADDQRVRIDFNHPLAGETVRYRVRILSVEDPGELH